MIKLVYCVTRKQGMTRAEFSEYWEKTHGLIGARIPGLRRLVQSHAVAVEGDAYEPDFDGMAELWFDDAAAILAARRSEAWADATADESNFIDATKTAYFVAEERQIL